MKTLSELQSEIVEISRNIMYEMDLEKLQKYCEDYMYCRVEIHEARRALRFRLN